VSGTYEVFIEVRHHQRHLEEYAEVLHSADKLVDTGDPQQMVVDALRGFADELEERWTREREAAAATARRADAIAAWEERQRAR
jgi:hypothetical protein